MAGKPRAQIDINNWPPFVKHAADSALEFARPAVPRLRLCAERFCPRCCSARWLLPALAGTYPVSGRWGQSASAVKGAIDCSGKRVIAFNGDQRTDSQGGVPAYRNKSVTTIGASRYRIVDVFTNGQINNAQRHLHAAHQADADHIADAADRPARSSCSAAK